MHVVMIGGSDAGISAALRARELDPAADVTVVLEDAYPNFSICGIPYYVSGEVTHWRNLAHRTLADLEAAGMRLRPDTTARRIDVPGRKLLVKGNHDYWWQTRSKMSRALHPTIEILQADSIIANRVAFAGTRGWLCPNDSHFEESDSKIYKRELERLKTALDPLRGRESEFDALIVALHYPPTNNRHEPSGFIELIEEYGADVCVYGHLHGDDIRTALKGSRGTTAYYLVSADAADFAPAEIIIQKPPART